MISDIKSGGSVMDDRVQAMWEQMNKGLANKSVKHVATTRSTTSTTSTSSQKHSNNWMTYLGLNPKKRQHPEQDGQHKGSLEYTFNKTLLNHSNSSSASASQKKSDNWMAYLGMETKKSESSGQEARKEDTIMQSAKNDESRKLAAAALSAVKEAAAAAAGRGKVEITEVRDFAGEEIKVKKLVDAESKEAAEKARGPSTSAVDAILEQIKKKPKLSVLDKSKKDWGEFKDENKGLEDQLDAYKKSSNQYLDKVSFLQRADYREYERERDARLAQQSRRKTDMRDDDL